MFNFFKDDALITLYDYSALYKIKVQNMLINPSENEPISFYSLSEGELTQTVGSDIINTFNFIEVQSGCNNEKFNVLAQRILVLSNIFKKLKFKRNKSGKIISLENEFQLQEYWKKWKETELDNFIPVLGEQEKFINVFERGLSNIKENIKNELQYIAVFPQCYQFKEYSALKKEYTDLYIYNSRLVGNAEIRYKFFPQNILVTNNIVKIILQSVITNESEVLSYIQEVNNKEISNKYLFKIQAKYEIDKNSGKLISSQIEMEESINNYLKYKINLEVDEVKNILERGTESYKIFEGKTYTKEEWGKFEQEQFKLYAQKNKIPLEEEKPKKGGKFFLDEKESDF